MLTKSQIIFVRDFVSSNEKPKDGFTFFRPSQDEAPEDKTDIDRAKLIIPSSVWKEFGEPDVITVTIEPGDLLNNSDSQEEYTSRIEKVSNN